MKWVLRISVLFITTVSTLSSLPAKAETMNDFFRELVEGLKQQESQNENSSRVSSPTIQGPVPLGEPAAAIPPECHPHEFQAQALNRFKNAQQFSQLTRSYFNKCSVFLREGNSKGLTALLKFALTEYDLSQNPQISKQYLTLSDGKKVEAFIGVKDLHTQRPWVIVKCGVFCDISSSSSSLNFVINLFDQSPFNVIFVSNHTGNRHIKLNNTLTLGGFYEVYDLYDVAHWLKYESPYQQTVDSIHATGISLGGSSAMAVSHLSDLYRSRENKPIFSSTTAICPVVNLGPTLQDMYANTAKGKLFTHLSWKYLKDAAPYLQEAKDYLSAKSPPATEKFPVMLSDIVLRYGIRWELSAPPGRNSATSPANIEDLMSVNHFSRINHRLEVPTFAWASQDDHIVNFNLNTKTLIETTEPVPNQGAVGLEYGDHCGFDTSYGFSATTAVLQSFILNNSPNFKAKRHLRRMMFPAKPPSFGRAEIHLRQWWVAQANKNTVALHYETFNPSRKLSCRFMNPFKSKDSCRQIYSQEISIKDLEELGARVPQNATQAQVLSRYLNYTVRLTQSGGSSIDGTIFLPAALSWYDY